MAGIAHLQSAMLSSSGVAVANAVLVEEAALGHNGHAASHAAAIGVAVWTPALEAEIAGHLGNLLVVLDARYAAGVHAGPIDDLSVIRGGLAFSNNRAVQESVLEVERVMGHYSRAGTIASRAMAAQAVSTIPILDAQLALFFADLDGRYLAGTATKPPGALAELQAALIHVVEQQATVCVMCMEHNLGHDGHAVVSAAVATAAASAAVAANTGWLTFLLNQLDARYAGHA